MDLASEVAWRREVKSAAPEIFKAGAIDGVDVGLRDVVGPDFELRKLGEVRAEDRADGAAANDANFHERPALPALLDERDGRFSEPL